MSKAKSSSEKKEGNKPEETKQISLEEANIIREQLGVIRRRRLVVQQASGKVDSLRAQLKEAKAIHDRAVNDLLDEIDDNQPRLPFGDKAPGEDDWQSVPVASLNLPATIVERLTEAGIQTVGDISAWTNEGHDLQEINGIGISKAEAIEDALENFWATRKGELDEEGEQDDDEDPTLGEEEYETDELG